MITKTVNLDSSYDALFEEIKAVSMSKHDDDPSINIIDINSLEQFFGNIVPIKALDEKFLRLPLDEPMFEIDANSRKIEVPADFKSNGISVQGDHLAETVFFSIDRYFDYKDLSTADIRINWKIGNETGRTKNFIMSNDIIPGHIVFGWPINNTITAKSGTLQFAVEFYQKNDENKVTYCFNTLVAVVNIKDGLVIGPDVEECSLDEEILASLTNSAFGEGEAAVGDVTWITGDGHGLVSGLSVEAEGGAIISFNPKEWQPVLNLDTIINAQDEPASVSTNLIAQAFVDNQTDIHYFDNSGNDLSGAMVKVETSRLLVEDRSNLDPNKVYYIGNGPEAVQATESDLADENIALYEVAPLNPNLIYQVQLAGEPVAYRKATAEEIAAWGTQEQVDLYCQIAIIRIDSAGSYVVKAQGEKWIQIPDPNDDSQMIDQKIGASETKRSDIVVVPAAQGPESIEIVEMGEIAGFNPEEGAYSTDPAFENVIFIPNEGRDIKAIAEFENLGAAQFTWQYRGFNDRDSAFVNLSESDSLFKLDNEDVQNVATEGVYRVLVKNFINNTTSNEVASANYTISKLASPIDNVQVLFSINNTDWKNIATNSPYFKNNRACRLKVDIANIVYEMEENKGGLRFKWYYSPPTDNEEFDWGEPKGLEAEYSAGVGSTGEGYYKVVVEHVYNGSVYTKELEPFYVDTRAT